MRAPLLQKLLLVLKYLSSGKKLPKDARIRLLQTLAYLWKILRPRLQIGTRRKGNSNSESTDTPTNTRTTQKRDNVVDITGSTNLTTSTPSTMASRNASRPTHQLHLQTGSEQDSQGGYTFSVESMDYQPTPISQRRCSSSLPQLGGPSTPRPVFSADAVCRTPCSPAASIIGGTRPAGDTGTDSLSTQDEMPNLAHDRIFPIMPEFFQRYTRAVDAEATDTGLTIQALMLNYKSHEDPPGWKPILRPEGVYFYNESKKVVTEANLYECKFYDQIMKDIATLEGFVSTHNIRLPERYTIAMDLNKQGEGMIYTNYYYADHTRKTLFFLDDLGSPTNLTVWREVKGITSLDHIRHEMESQYRYHGMLYPSTTPVPERAADLRDITLHYIGDATTSHLSTSPFNLSDLNSMLSSVDSPEKNIGSQATLYTDGASILLCEHPHHRIHRDQSAHGKQVKQRTFSIKLNEEWREFILYATVLLNANASFLAVQSISTTVKPYRSPTQILSYLSTVLSIGSIILGLLLMRQNRAHRTTNDFRASLKARSHPTFGLEALAILYSLPCAFFLWGTVSFIVAFAWNCFDDPTIPTPTIISSAWVAFAVLVFWCIWAGWLKEPEPDTDTEAQVEVANNPSVKDERVHLDDNSTSNRAGRGVGGRVVL